MSKKKTILFLADAESIHTARWVDYFMTRNHIVHVATFASHNVTSALNIYYLSNRERSHRGGNYHYLRAVPELKRLIKKVDPDVINAHYSYSAGLIALLAHKAAGSHSRLSIACHGSDVLNPPRPRWVFDAVNRFVLRRADRIFAVSDQIYDRLRLWDIPERKIFVGQYGVEYSSEPVGERDIDVLSNRADVPNSSIDALLNGLNHPDFQEKHFIFVLPHVKPERLTRLKSMYPAVTFLEAVGHHEMLNMLGRTRVYVSGTRSDGASLSLLEAMERGCYPIVSNIPANRSWIADGINGALFYRFDEIKDLVEEGLREEENFRALNRSLIRRRAEYQTQMAKIERFLGISDNALDEN